MAETERVGYRKWWKDNGRRQIMGTGQKKGWRQKIVGVRKGWSRRGGD